MLALCEASSKPVGDVDPCNHKDPWGHYMPSLGPAEPTSSIQQMESSIESAVLAKLPAPTAALMEQDDLPERMSTLEGQVHQLMAKQQVLENQFQDFSTHHGQQMTAMQPNSTTMDSNCTDPWRTKTKSSSQCSRNKWSRSGAYCPNAQETRMNDRMGRNQVIAFAGFL